VPLRSCWLGIGRCRDCFGGCL